MIETAKRVVCDICGFEGPVALESEDPVELALAEDWAVNMDGTDAVCPDKRCRQIVKEREA